MSAEKPIKVPGAVLEAYRSCRAEGRLADRDCIAAALEVLRGELLGKETIEVGFQALDDDSHAGIRKALEAVWNSVLGGSR